MGKVTEFLSKLRYPTVFLALGAILALAAAAQTIKMQGVEFVPYGLPARLGLAVLALVLLGIGVTMVFTGSGAVRPQIKPLYDVFLASPMAGTTSDEEYKSIRDLCLDVLAIMCRDCGISTYYFVGEKLETKARFESYDVAAETDFDALGASRNLVLIYPRPAVSSVLAEVGFALARGIPSTLFVAKSEDLPYLLRQAGQLPEDRFPPVRVCEYGTPENLKQMVHNDGEHLFNRPYPQPPEAE